VKHLLALLLLCGCRAIPAVDVPVTVETHVGTNTEIMVVCIGWRNVDPTAPDWQGWDGDCPGADVDARGFYAAAVECGYPATMLLDAAAKWDACETEILRRGSLLKRDDWLIITESGHGGQIPDDDGDEADGLDETVCAWDQNVRDDRVLELFAKLAEQTPGLNVAPLSDQCHAEGNWRAWTRPVQQFFTLGLTGARDLSGIPLIDNAKLEARLAGLDITIFQIGGCREEESSYGGHDGGVLKYRGRPLAEWFSVTEQAMPANQKPVFVTFGNVTPEKLQKVLFKK
jgi:hypothetical protein